MLCIMDVKKRMVEFINCHKIISIFLFTVFVLAKHYFYVGYMFFLKDSLSALENEDCVKLIMHYIDHQYCCF